MAGGSSSPGGGPPPRRRVAAYVDLDLVGDALIKLPFVRALRHAFPDAELIWVAGRGRSAFAGALAPLMPGLLDRVIEQCGVGAGLRAALGGKRLDVLIDTQSHVGTTLALRRLWPRRFVTAAANYWLSGVRPAWSYRKPRRLVRRLLDLAALASGTPADASGVPALPEAARTRAAALLPAGPCYVAQVIGAGGRHKAWPLDRHIALAEALAAAGRVPVLILGPEEEALAPALAARLPMAVQPLQAAGGTAGVDLTIALGARCAAAVAGDCGGGHMMAAAGVPLVSLFGPTDPAKFAPWGERVHIMRAQAFGAAEMAAIPAEAVLAAVEATIGDRDCARAAP
jgi:ADP-heptose:LPS heptosyltransferase